MGIQTIELLLDERSESAVRAEWEVLEKASLRRASTQDRPHITMTARQRIDSAAEDFVTRRCSVLPLSVRLGAPLLFPDHDRVVLVRSVVPTAALLHLQAEVHRALGDSGEVSATCLPGAWTPHVTLTRLSIDDVPSALRLIMESGEREVTIERARRWDGTARRAWDLAPL